MTFCDFEEDGDLELLVGSDDYEIRIFKGEEVRCCGSISILSSPSP